MRLRWFILPPIRGDESDYLRTSRGTQTLQQRCGLGNLSNLRKEPLMTALTAGKTVTISVLKMPAAPRHRKTIERLMRLQPAVQRTLTRVAKRRGRENPRNQRGGRMWTSRIPATRCVSASLGATFPLKVTAKIIPDIQAVSRFIKIA